MLASKSPRRHHLLHALGIDFQVRTKEVEEIFPEDLLPEQIPVYLAELKARSFLDELKDRDLLITADTIVFLENKVLGKPEKQKDAESLLQMLSGKEHQVITGVCLSSIHKQKSFYAITNVQFKKLSSEEINFYIQSFQPFDKAGAYGIQEWIGYIGISHIEGSFYNVMGLPIQKLYEEIIKF
ncbi:MAG: Maf family nucleotide pyrophosphatase [Bacteroidota bacterium]